MPKTGQLGAPPPDITIKSHGEPWLLRLQNLFALLDDCYEVNENLDEWLTRREKRQRSVDFIKRSDWYQSLTDPPQAPEACNRRLSKRQWEMQMKEWRNALESRLAAAKGKLDVNPCIVQPHAARAAAPSHRLMSSLHTACTHAMS